MSGPNDRDDDDDDDDDEGGPDPDDEWGDGDDLMDDLFESRPHRPARGVLCGCGAMIRWRRAFLRRGPDRAMRRIWVVDTPCRDGASLRQSHLVYGRALVLFAHRELILLDEVANEVTLEDGRAWRATVRFDA